MADNAGSRNEKRLSSKRLAEDTDDVVPARSAKSRKTETQPGGAASGRAATTAKGASASTSASDSNVELRVASWNVGCINDGVTERFLMFAARYYCAQLLTTKSDVICFQELTMTIDHYICQLLGKHYVPIPAEPPMLPYYTRIFVCAQSVKTRSCQRRPFPQSDMMRDLTWVELDKDGVSFVVSTTHLESLATYSDARTSQLAFALRTMQGMRSQCQVLVGDLNIREHEARAVADKDFPQFKDAWVDAGQDVAHRWTWKSDRFVEQSSSKTYKSRYDRGYIRGGRCTTFRTLGEKPMVDGRYCSDHLGIVFDVAVQNHEAKERNITED